jgi:hypothetical protein
VASTGAIGEADKAQNPKPNVQVKDEAENDEVLIPDVEADDGANGGPMVGPTVLL